MMLLFLHRVSTMLADEGACELELRKEQLQALDQCIEKLTPDRRKLAISAYSNGTTIREMARQMKKTEGSLYQMLARIRTELHRCVSRKMPGASA